MIRLIRLVVAQKILGVYTSREYRKLELDYEPLSTYGIGFLSCFLVGDNVVVRTHKQGASSESIELTVPNVEGCFFVEAVDSDLPIGTSVVVQIAKESPVYLADLLEYIGDTVQDIPFDVVVSRNSPALTRYRVVDEDGRALPMCNTDIMALARSQAIPPRAEYAFVQGTILVNDEDEDYRKLWWNKYLRGKLGGAELAPVTSAVRGLTYPRHYARGLGSAFRLHVPLSDKAPQDVDGTMNLT